jgi:hypothetical protein
VQVPGELRRCHVVGGNVLGQQPDRRSELCAEHQAAVDGLFLPWFDDIKQRYIEHDQHHIDYLYHSVYIDNQHRIDYLYHSVYIDNQHRIDYLYHSVYIDDQHHTDYLYHSVYIDDQHHTDYLYCSAYIGD